jgi:putative membrane protein insertion efficiency factor
MTPAAAVGGLLRACIRAYQLMISPLFPQSCRFHPTCSQYAIEAIAEHGPGRGLWLGAKRIARCHPFHPGGLDEVPRGTPHGS